MLGSYIQDFGAWISHELFTKVVRTQARSQRPYSCCWVFSYSSEGLCLSQSMKRNIEWSASTLNGQFYLADIKNDHIFISVYLPKTTTDWILLLFDTLRPWESSEPTQNVQVALGFDMQLLAYKHEGKANWSKSSMKCRQLAQKSDGTMALQYEIK